MIEAGATHVFLEKPGAPSVKELQEMRAYAASKGVPVYMGYNKNVTPYVQKARDEIAPIDTWMPTYTHPIYPSYSIHPSILSIQSIIHPIHPIHYPSYPS